MREVEHEKVKVNKELFLDCSILVEWTGMKDSDGRVPKRISYSVFLGHI